MNEVHFFPLSYHLDSNARMIYLNDEPVAILGWGTLNAGQITFLSQLTVEEVEAILNAIYALEKL